VSFVKVDCNADFKAIGKELGIRVAPTFHLYKKGEKVGEMTGAHVERLQALVEEQLGGGGGKAAEEAA
jgi:thioredoxin 1